MTRILHVALRDFLATVMTKGFIIGLLVAPAIGGVMFIVGPRLFDDGRYQVEGEYTVVDPTGAVLPAMSAALDPGAVAERRMNEFRRTLGDAPAVRGMAEAAVGQSMDDALGPAPNVRVRALPAGADVEAAKAWLNEESDGLRHTALIVIHEHAVRREPPAAAQHVRDAPAAGSSQPPPWWEVWLSIAVGLASVGAVWVAAKAFRIGLLMYGKPPDLKTLIRWVRAA